MKKIFLASAFHEVGGEIHSRLGATSKFKVAFIPTAADVYDAKPWMEADRQKLVNLGYQVEDYDIKDKTETAIYNDLSNKDIIFVSGGNTFYLLYHAQQSGFDHALEKLIEEGKIYIGSSAGSILLAPTIEPVKLLDNPEQAPGLRSFDGLGLVDFVALPHYGNEKYKDFHKSIIKEWSSRVKLVPIADEQFIIWKDEKGEVVERGKKSL